MRNSNQDLAELFYQDDFKAVLHATLDGPGARFDASDIVYIIGSLTFIARIDEAKSLFESFQSQLNPSERCSARFFLAIAACRHYHGDESKAHLLAMFRERHNGIDKKARFYIHQGIAFYNYTYGKSRKALPSIQRAFSIALLSSFTYGRLLAADLKAQVHMHLGEIRRGLKVLEELRDFARLHELKGAELWTSLSLVHNQAHYGLLGAEAANQLLEWIDNPIEVDSYSKASLVLELVRQALLSGRPDSARAWLDQAHQLVYQVANPRLEMQLHMAEASFQKARGDIRSSLKHVERALLILDQGSFDKNLEQNVRGFYWSLTQKSYLLTELQTLQRQYPSYLNGRILNRALGIISPTVNYGEDPLGDALDDLKVGEQHVLDTILRHGWLGLLSRWANISPWESTIYLNLDGMGSLTSFERGMVNHRPRTLTPLIRSLFMSLTKGERTKEEILIDVWGYESYHPERHNNIIYSLFVAARKALGIHADWIVSGEQGYSLRGDIKIRLKPLLTETPLQMETPVEEESDPNLTARQNAALQRFRLSKENSIDVKSYQSWFEISEATALRDLKQLVQHRYLEVKGQARATRYQLTQDEIG